MKSVLETQKVTEDHLRKLEPAITAYTRGKLNASAMATVMSDWIAGKDYDLGMVESLPSRILRVIEKYGPTSAKQIADRLDVTPDTVLHSLHRLEKRRDVEARRGARPLMWSLCRGDKKRGRA